MKKVLLFLLLIAILFISACSFYKINEKECKTDDDCATGGCSGEVCTIKDNADNIVTTCIFKPEYECLKLTKCRCINGKCQWEETNDYKGCIENLP